ncbi:MAG: sulfate ABC transporter ATP-binding protein [Planctomycetota bacterium]|nr:MAG: sulfate ABC transporter ATP-binding protein [Planctomycetota bacterium]
MSIEARDVSKHFGAFTALDHVNLHVPTGELVALLGPSGSGKTTLLRIIAGLESPDPGSGPILFHDEDVADRRVGERRVGFVFQHYALFRHMTVFENVAFGLRVRPRADRPSRSEISERVHALLKLVQLDWLADRYPSQLSGGQRQRVALARALAVEPKVLLLDEPFGALDARVRQELRRWLRRLHDEIHVTSVFVTHDQEEALEVADRVVVMNEGKIIQVGSPAEVFHDPASEFVMQFLGRVNVFSGRVEHGKAVFDSLEWDYPEHVERRARPAKLMVRPHNLVIHAKPSGKSCFPARVTHVNAAGPTVKVELVRESGEPVFVEVTRGRYAALDLHAGNVVYVSPRELRVFVEKEDDSSIEFNRPDARDNGEARPAREGSIRDWK